MTTPPTTRIPPQSVAAEQALLGAILAHGESADYAVGAVRVSDFYREAHGAIYDAIIDLRKRREPVDIVTVSEQLRADGKLDAVGGARYLAELAYNVPSSAGIQGYARIVTGAAKQRALIRWADSLANAAYAANPGTADELTDAALGELLEISARGTTEKDPRRIGDVMADVFRDIEKRAAGGTEGFYLRMPWPDLRNVVRPAVAGDLIVIGARPGMGKTAFALNMAMAWGTQGHAGIIASLEMTDDGLANRALISGGRATADDLADLEDGQSHNTEDVLRALAESLGAAHAAPVHIDDCGLSVAQLRTRIRRLKARGENIQWAVVDYIQLVKGDVARGRSRAEEVGRIAYDLKRLAKEEGIAVVALSQLSRAVESHDSQSRSRRPNLSHFKESGDVEAAADLALALYRPSVYGEAECERARFPTGPAFSGLTGVLVLKQRRGISAGFAVLSFEGNKYRFRGIDDTERQAIKSTGGGKRR
jgi:replicative DNA helicase